MPPDRPARIDAIYRYPVKGLSPQRLDRVTLSPGATLPADRLYAIENGPSGFDPAAPKYFPKERFLMLMRNERLAALRTDYEEASHTLVIHTGGREAARQSRRFSRPALPASCAAPPRYWPHPGTASRTWPGKWSPSSIWPRWR